MSNPGTPTPELTSYNGNCHCGAIKFTVKIPSLKEHKVMSCNCSLCTRNGYLMIYPRRKDVIFHSGCDDDGGDDDDDHHHHLTSYTVLQRNVHKFCSTCGCCIIGERIATVGDDGQLETDDHVAINVGALRVIYYYYYYFGSDDLILFLGD